MKLRPYQQECVAAFYSNYEKRNGSGNGLFVLPTAAGKSIVIGKLITEIVQQWSDQRILLLSHVSELIKQNHQKIMMFWPQSPAGIYAAGLGKRQAHFPIVTAMIQSVYKLAHLLGHRDVVIVDECHLINHADCGMYRELFAALRLINPNCIFVGFTATDYRTETGQLTEGDDRIFDHIIYEISLSRLLNEGYLTPPIGKSSLIQADMRGVKITAGEFNTKEMAARFDQKEFLNKALDNDMQFFEGRNTIAHFCATIENAHHVAAGMCDRGIHTEVMDGTMRMEHREYLLEAFRSGQLRSVASVGTMTTGTDVPNIDFINLLIAMRSPGKYQQIIGRGFRVQYADGYDIETIEGRISAIAAGPKPNFMVTDHGGNILRHGPITNVAKPEPRVKGARYPAEKPKCRICEICRTANTLEAINCIICGSELKIPIDPTAALDLVASDADIMGTPFTRGEIAQWFTVDDVTYNRHIKRDSSESLRVTYYCGEKIADEWHKIGFIRPWWIERSGAEPMPKGVLEALPRCKMLRRPTRVMLHKKGKYFEVVKYDFKPLEVLS